MSTHSRLACALCALGLITSPSVAAADTGGAAYRAKNERDSRSARAVEKPRSVRLGDRVPVRRGMRGADVRALQALIRRAGIRLTADGVFGRRTWLALRRIERRAGRRVDGVLGRRDLRLIKRVAGRGWPRPAPPAELPAGSRAKVGRDGLAIAPARAPAAVKAIIAAGNEIATKPYRYGGGHGRWRDSGYDCSGSVSYALHGAGLLKRSMPSGGFTTWGRRGRGRWVTIYANAGHMYMVVAGLRFDTSGRSRTGSRWQSARRSARGYTVRHPAGL